MANETVETALRLLEREGLLVGQGPGRRRRIVIPEGEIETTRLRVGLLVHDFDRLADELSHLLKEAGHIPVKPHKTLLDLGMDAKRVAGFVRQAEADVWVVFSASREVLVWFAEQETPVFALFGQADGCDRCFHYMQVRGRLFRYHGLPRQIIACPAGKANLIIIYLSLYNAARSFSRKERRPA